MSSATLAACGGMHCSTLCSAPLAIPGDSGALLGLPGPIFSPTPIFRRSVGGSRNHMDRVNVNVNVNVCMYFSRVVRDSHQTLHMKKADLRSLYPPSRSLARSLAQRRHHV